MYWEVKLLLRKKYPCDTFSGIGLKTQETEYLFLEKLILPLWCADVHVSVFSMIWNNLFSTELSPLTEELHYFPYRQGSEHRLQIKRHKPLLIVLSHRFHSAAAGG